MAEESREALEAVRLEKLRKIEALGHDPWGQRFDDHQAIADVRGLAATLPQPGGSAARCLAPRSGWRGGSCSAAKQGKVYFLELRDWTERIQIFIGNEPGRRGGLEPGGRARPGRPDRRRRHARPHPDRRADRLRHRLDVPGQEPCPAAREVARADRRRTALPEPLVDLFSNPESLQTFLGRSKVIAAFRAIMGERGFVEVETPDDAADRRGRGGPAVRHPPQHARPDALPADRPRALPEAAAGRRHGAGLRDRPGLSQRGDQPAAQPRVHHDGGVPGLRRLSQHDGPDRGPDRRGDRRARRQLSPPLHPARRAARSRSTSLPLAAADLRRALPRACRAST